MVGSIQDVAQRRRLRGLASEDVRELAGALFGDVPHARLVRWLHEVAGGNPMRVLDSARHLIDRKTLRFVGGLWVIPDELDFFASSRPASRRRWIARCSASRPRAARSRRR